MHEELDSKQLQRLYEFARKADAGFTVQFSRKDFLFYVSVDSGFTSKRAKSDSLENAISALIV